MDRLKGSLAAILNDFDNSSRVVYVDYPVHLNIGDLLINLGAEQFFKDNNLNIVRRYYLLDIPELIPDVDDQTVFMMHGGGNFGDIWDTHQSMRENLLHRYPRNRFIFLPQTVHFNSAEEEKSSLSRMALHRNAKFYARDSRSFEILKRNGISELGLLPDMAQQLWEIITPSSLPIKETPFYLIRKDRETKGIPNSSLVPDTAERVDWEDIISLANRSKSAFARRFMRYQAKFKGPFDNSRIWYPIRDGAVQDGIRSVSAHNEVVSDRLHAMILGLLLRRKVIAMDNYYGKISTYASTWLSGADLLQLVDA